MLCVIFFIFFCFFVFLVFCFFDTCMCKEVLNPKCLSLLNEKGTHNRTVKKVCKMKKELRRILYYFAGGGETGDGGTKLEGTNLDESYPNSSESSTLTLSIVGTTLVVFLSLSLFS